MIKKIVEISQQPCKLRVRNDQLIVSQSELPERSIPCEDVGLLIVDNKAVSYTHSVFTNLLDYGAAIVLCGDDHHPAGMFMPLESNSIQRERHGIQVAASLPQKKQLWKQIVSAKIRHLGAVIKGHALNASEGLYAMSRQVLSGDTSNVEARASKLFWKYYIPGLHFRREHGGAAPNNLLNYGYMVLRAAVARAVCSAGLLPTLGLHHCNRYNAFCLADDLMEPYRGYIDEEVLNICRETGGIESLYPMTQHHKARLLSVLYVDVCIEGVSGPLMVQLHKTAASLVRCLANEQKQLELPAF